MNVAVHPEHLNILSLCTGGGGLDLGFELAVPGARTVCMVEREGFAVAHMVSAMEAGLMAPAPIWSDARTFDGRRWRGCVDGLIGGIPCQPHSLAGRKRGSLDARDLWSDARRIIVQSRAWFALIENVGGMLSAGDDEIAGAERVFRDLHKLGFEVEGGLFSAAEVGAPHQRERVFILAVADARFWSSERRGGTGYLAGEGGGPEREAQQRERRGHAVSYRSEGVADSFGFGSASRLSTEAGRNGVRAEPAITFNGSDAVGDSSIARSRSIPIQQGRQIEASADANWSSLFPPGPGDLSGWASVLASAPELEPAVRVVADELVRGIHGTLLDRTRVDQLRLLGNGVVPLQAAYAIRVLTSRLASRGSNGAAFLSRMIENGLKDIDDFEATP